MNILLTNDDGFNSEGINVLKSLLEKHGTVVIIAPDKHRSGASSSLTITDPIKVEKVEDKVFKCNGTPVDCVSFGLSSLNVKFDLVVSGCNDGYNISYDTNYSGTVGAALEALVYHVPSIAVSTCRGSDFREIKQYFDQVFDYINRHNLLSEEYILNINFPFDEVKGISIGKLYYRNDENFFTKKQDGYYAYRKMDDEYNDKDTDCYQINHGIISIVPLGKTLYNDSNREELLKKIK